MKGLKDLLDTKTSSQDTYRNNLQRSTSFLLLLRYILAHRSQIMNLLPFGFDFGYICAHKSQLMKLLPFSEGLNIIMILAERQTFRKVLVCID